MFSKLLALTVVAFATAMPAAPTMNLVELAESVPALSTLVVAVKAAGLVATLESPGPFTVLAPTNDAFNNLPAGVLQKLLQPENKATLVEILTYHVAAGNVQAGDLTNGMKIKMVEGSNVTAFVRGSEVTFEGGAKGDIAKVVQANAEATNGVAHVIDAVLLPPATLAALMDPPTKNLVELAASVPALSTLVVAVKAAGLVATLESPGPFTVLAPTNDAFNALPAGVLQKLLQPENKAALVQILTYHVAAGNVQAGDLTNGMKIKTVEGSNVTAFVRGSEVTFEGGAKGDIAKVVQANAEATNGVAHVIDAILIPPATMQQLVGDVKNIVELAESVPTLSTLVTAIKAAGLVDTLEGKGPFTVFAPTNEAFDALPSGVLTHLLRPENKAELAAVLTYHVVAGNVSAGDLKNDEKIKTVEGSDIAVFLKNKEVIIEGGTQGDYAKVLQANVYASNGVVHVIDHVLLPPHHPHPGPAPGPANRTIVELAVANPELSTLVTALKAADLVSTLSSAGPFTVFAPTNQAFADLPAGVLQKLLEPANKAELVKILTYHVAAGNFQAKDLHNEQYVKTVEGEHVEILIRGEEGFIKGEAHDNYAKILKVNDEASNGVIHIIDHILLPAEKENKAYASAL